MGCFSWLKADILGEVANVLIGEQTKLLVPKEFGGGCIIGTYEGHGEIAAWDIFELLAWWNLPLSELKGTEGFNEEDLKCIDEYTDYNRELGIELAENMDKLKYPLKLVSIDYECPYENLGNYSTDDPNQGTAPIYRKESEK